MDLALVRLTTHKRSDATHPSITPIHCQEANHGRASQAAYQAPRGES